MYSRSGLFPIACSFVLAATFTVACYADTIRLKDGGIIKGHVTSFIGGNFVVEIGNGSKRRQLIFAASEVESIIFDPPARDAAPPINQPIVNPTPAPKVVQPPKVVATESTSRGSQTQPKPQAQQPASSAKSQPTNWTKKVLADNTNNGWTNAGWVVKKGQRIHIVADGKVSLGSGNTSSPSGLADLKDERKLMRGVPTGALIAIIGDDDNDFIYIGAEREFTAKRDGTLFLGINESNLGDNSGAFEVKIEIQADMPK